jgi:hypothetical protein
VKNRKACERNLAELLGSKRVPVSGRARGDTPDIEHPELAIECTSRRRLPAVASMEAMFHHPKVSRLLRGLAAS